MVTSNINELVKVSLIGYPACGKTSILNLLSEKTIEKCYIPTQGFDLKTVKFDKILLRLWDFGGQKQFIKMYLKDYLKGSDVVFVVTDSTPQNVSTSKELIDYASELIDEDCPIIAIANKQDLCEVDGRMTAERVENVLRVKTIGLTAIKRSERKKLISEIKDELHQVLIRRGLREK